jgi:hypothetical protein
MISLLHLLHAIAAERGDGLLPELRKHLHDMEANKPDESNPQEPRRCQDLTLAGHERVSEQKPLSGVFASRDLRR